MCERNKEKKSQKDVFAATLMTKIIITQLKQVYQKINEGSYDEAARAGN